MSPERVIGSDLALQELRAADTEWKAALAGMKSFDVRMRRLADAAEHESDALRLVARAGLAWRPRPGASAIRLGWDVDPGGPRPGPPQVWKEFDAAVTRLGRAMEEGSTNDVARAFDAVCDGARLVADRLKPPEEDEQPAADSGAG